MAASCMVALRPRLYKLRRISASKQLPDFISIRWRHQELKLIADRVEAGTRVVLLQRIKPPSSSSSNDNITFESSNESPEEEKEDWISSIQEFVKVRLLQWRSVGEPWQVPWGAGTILKLVLTWIISFWFVSFVYLCPYSWETLSFKGRLLNDLQESTAAVLISIVVLHIYLGKFRPLPAGWFSLSLRGNWLFDVIFGCLIVFPLFYLVFQIDVKPLNNRRAHDPMVIGLCLLTRSVLGPIHEEIVFRGFLLPSLTRYMPLACSIVITGLAFGLIHLNGKWHSASFGVLAGAMYAKSRNLLNPLLLHSLWNLFVTLKMFI